MKVMPNYGSSKITDNHEDHLLLERNYMEAKQLAEHAKALNRIALKHHLSKKTNAIRTTH
jgi:hypothetical protein